MFWIHPALQTAATIIALYVLSLGWRRFQSLHLGGKGHFAWKRHVALGKVALAMWILGALAGIAVVRLEWGVFFLTGPHAWTGLIFIALAVSGYVSGSLLDKVKKRRFWLPLLHGANNLLLVILAFSQSWTGWQYLP